MTEIPKGEEITDSITNHVDRRFINSIDLVGKGDCVVTIARVEKLDKITYENKNVELKPILLYFDHTKKPLVLNKTNIKTLTNALGTNNVSKWKGRKVKVFAEKGKFFGVEQYAVRFRSQEVVNG